MEKYSMPHFQPFEQARALVRARRLSSRIEWVRWTRDPDFPADLPRTPHVAYKHQGWGGYSDWLGNGRPFKARRHRPFPEARAAARALAFTTARQYMAWAHSPQRPPDMPLFPSHVYAGHWQGWNDYLDTADAGSTRRSFRPFPEAREFARALSLPSLAEWKRRYAAGLLPADLPLRPEHTYADKGWAGTDDWLGTGKPRRRRRPKQWRPFEQAREYARAVAREHNVRSENRWRVWVHRPDAPSDLPVAPYAVYRHTGWAGYGDWFGQPARLSRFSFEEARAYARTLGLKNRAQWRTWAGSDARPPHIPPAPWHTYRKTGWAGIHDWLGVEGGSGSRSCFLPFEQAREYARTQSGCRSFSMWCIWIKSPARPPFIPTCPAQVYKNNGWAGFNDWLGTTYAQAQREGTERGREMRRPLREQRLAEREEQDKRALEARIALRAARHAARAEQNRRREAGLLPPLPRYNAGRYLPFPEAREFVRGLQLGSLRAWYQWAKSGQRPPNIPSNPYTTYQDTGWMGFADWVGYAGQWTPFSMCVYIEARQSLWGESVTARARAVLLSRPCPPDRRALVERIRAAFVHKTGPERDQAIASALCPGECA